MLTTELNLYIRFRGLSCRAGKAVALVKTRSMGDL